VIASLSRKLECHSGLLQQIYKAHSWIKTYATNNESLFIGIWLVDTYKSQCQHWTVYQRSQNGFGWIYPVWESIIHNLFKDPVFHCGWYGMMMKLSRSLYLQNERSCHFSQSWHYRRPPAGDWLQWSGPPVTPMINITKCLISIIRISLSLIILFLNIPVSFQPLCPSSCPHPLRW
jgi:hypothetical protein